MLLPLRLALAGLVLALVGCPAKPPVVKEPECSATKACAGGLVCQEGVCVACKRDRECARNELCHPIKRRCELRPCYGNACQVHDDCGLGQFCVQGECLQPGAATADGCQVVSCADGEACNEGQRCNPVNLVCEEDLGCTADGDCGTGLRCNVAAGRCEAACTGETAVAVCGVKKVCSQGRCVDCLKDADCGGGLKCNTATNICESLTSCIGNRDCEPPLVCNHVTRQCTVDPGPCLSAEDCGQDETCQLSTGKCVPARCVADRFEPDDTLAQAKPLAQGTTPNLTICKGDLDVFKLALARGDRLQVVVDVDPLLNFDLAVLDATGNLVAQGELAVDATVSVPGDYYVRARSSDAYVRYGLRTTVSRGVPCDADPEEPDDDFQHAAVLPPGDTFGKTICPGDVDFYAVAVQVGQTLEVQMTSSPLDGDLDLYLYASNGTRELARSATSAEVESATTAILSGNRVYVKVVGATPAVQNRYDLHVTVKGP